MPSSAQVVPVVVLFDYLLSDTGVGMSGQRVTVVLNSTAPATSVSPPTVIAQVQQSTTTDGNGYWQFSLVPNTNISPANTTYTVLTPAGTYDVTLGAVGPYQSTALGTIVNVPVPLSAPAASSIPSLLVSAGEPGIDTVGAGALLLGDNTATSVEIGSGAVPININGQIVATSSTGMQVNAAGDISARSLTLSASSPYAPNLPGNAAVATPAGTTAGKLWDWGGMVYHAMGTGAKGDGVTDDTTNLQNGITTATTANMPFYFEGESVSFLISTLNIPSGAKVISLGLPSLKLKNATNASMLQFNDVAHTDTHIVGLLLDANGANQTSAFAAAIGSVISPTVLSHNRTLVEHCTILNAAVHGIFLTEATAGQSNNPKFVRHNIINGHGLKTTGFGIYADYCGNTIIEGNFATNASSFDCIELGHAGPGWLTNLGSLTCVYNIVKGGQINFPFSDNARIEGNFVLNSKISNDLNTANNVAIVGNTVWAPTTSIPAGASGINATGANPLIEGNYVSVGQNDGIGDASHAQSGARIIGNIVDSTNGTNNGTGIHVGGNTNGTSNDCIAADNLITGHFVTAIDLVGNNCMVHDNRINLTGGTNGIKLWGSATMGFVAGVNGNIHDNAVAGCTNPIILPVPGTDAAVPGLQVRNNVGITAGTTNGFACGLPAYRSAVSAAAVPTTACTVTTPNDGVKHQYRISTAVTITTLGSGSFNLEVTYTDDNGTARTCIIPVCAEAGTYAALANTADAWKGHLYIMVNPNTVITVLTAGTFTTCTYNWSGLIEQVA